MRTRLALLVAVATLASTVLIANAGSACGDAPAMAPLTFDPPTVFDLTRHGGEPSVMGLPDPNGSTLLYSSHAGTTHLMKENLPDTDFVTPYNGSVYLWRSEDVGRTWDYVGIAGTEVGPHGMTGFSDPTLTYDTAGNVYIAGISPDTLYVAKSADQGRTWTSSPFATILTDREWLAADEENVVYLNGNQTGRGRRLWKSVDGGLTFNEAGSIKLPNTGPPSPIAVDQSDGRLFFPSVDYTVYPGEPSGVAVYPSARAGVYSDRIDAEVPGGLPHASGFINAITLDKAGNIYVASNTNREVRVSYSTDRGLTWQTSTVASGTATVLWPWVSAGSDGRVGVSWLQSNRSSNTESGAAQYRVHAAQSITAHGWTDGCNAEHPPVWQRSLVTPQPIHDGTICQQGLACNLSTGADRRLGDYHTNSITADGTFVVAYGNTTAEPDGAISHPGFARQSGGVDFTE